MIGNEVYLLVRELISKSDTCESLVPLCGGTNDFTKHTYCLRDEDALLMLEVSQVRAEINDQNINDPTSTILSPFTTSPLDLNVLCETDKQL